MRIPLIIITGYLGAGKTTLVRRIIPELDKRALRGVLIENEIGEINVDGILTADSSIQQIELLGGCVCCSLRGDLFSALGEAIRSYKPDYLLIEASGLAEPAELIDAATAQPLIDQVHITDIVCIADAANLALQLKLGELAKLQAKFASAILLNKRDAVREGELEPLTAKLREMNEHAPIIPCEQSASDVSVILANTFAWLDGAEAPAHLAQGEQAHEHDHHHHHHAGHYALNISFTRALSKQELLDALAALPERAYRVKGFAEIEGSDRPWVFQRVGAMPPRATEFTLDGVPVPIGMVIIGPSLSAGMVEPALQPIGAQIRSVTE